MSAWPSSAIPVTAWWALTSEDNWATAQLAGVAPYETQATTAAVVGDDIYVVHPHFADEDPPSVERVVFQ